MSATDIIAIITVGTVAVIVVMMALVRMAEGRSVEDSETATDLTVNAEVAKLRAEVQDLRRARRPSSTFMDMADALNRLANPPPTYDEASLEVPLMDLQHRREAMEPETITITITKVGDKHQFAVNATQSPLLCDSASAAIKAVWLSFAAAENITNSGSEGERMDGVGMAMLIKAILSVCVDHVKEQIQGATLDQRLAAGSRLRALFAEQRIPSDDLVKLVLTTLLEARLVRPQPADKKIEDEIQDLCRTIATP